MTPTLSQTSFSFIVSKLPENPHLATFPEDPEGSVGRTLKNGSSSSIFVISVFLAKAKL